MTDDNLQIAVYKLTLQTNITWKFLQRKLKFRLLWE